MTTKTGYPKSLKYFMWPWQVYFRIACRTSAQDLFNRLEKNLNPDVILIGFSTNGAIPAICVDHENRDYLIPRLENIKDVASEIFKSKPEKDMIYSGVGMQEEVSKRAARRSYREALENVLNVGSDEKFYFASNYVTIDGYTVFVVLELNRHAYESHMHLTLHVSEDGTSIKRSLIEAAVEVYLDDKWRVLHLPEAGRNGNHDSRNTEELLREAGKLFFYAISIKGRAFDGLHSLIQDCEGISLLKYEGIDAKGQIIIARKDHPAIEMTLVISEPFSISNHLKARKYLMMTDDEVGVICDSDVIHGLGKIKQNYDYTTESVFRIYLTGTHCWTVYHQGTAVLKMQYGVPEASYASINKEKFYTDTKLIFPLCTERQIDNLFYLSTVLANQNRGAMLIVSSLAYEEAARLKNRSIRINKIKLDKDSLLRLTTVDGGVLINEWGEAFAHGVILDGVVGSSGDSSRGSRYNSALTYHEYWGSKIKTMIVVVSEDGMVNVIPSIGLRIKRSEIVDMIDLLESMTEEDKFDRSQYYKVMDWLRQRNSYLAEHECERVNAIKDQLSNLDFSKSTMSVVQTDLAYDANFNRALYVEEDLKETP